MRKLIGVIAGIITGYVVVVAVEFANSLMFVPQGIDPTNEEQMLNVVAGFPAAAFLILLLGWFLGALVGAWVAGRVGRSRLSGYIVAIFFLLATVSNFFFLPHPLWVMGTGVVLTLLGGFVGARAGKQA